MDKGQIIEMLQNEINKLKKMNTEPSLEEQIKYVGRSIRNEIQSSSQTFSNWPPTEGELYTKLTDVPYNLHILLRTIIAKPGRVSEHKNVIISSLAQDILFNSSGGKKKTLKHVIFPFCVKRKSGSKELLSWINRLGYGISYDEIVSLETSLANDAVKNQSVRSFSPSTIQPSLFLSFIWDNNDINPDSLTGQMMHCTNGIVVQLTYASSLDDGNSSLRRTERKRERRFDPMPITMTAYYSQKRHLPSNSSINCEVL